jgi:hypothetical protein
VTRTIELVLLLALVVMVAWPVRRTGERFLLRWGVARPTRAQADAAARYLRHRRMLYPICWAFGPALVLLVAEWTGAGTTTEARRAFGLLASVLAALLIAEIVAILRPARGATRSAVLSRRRWYDLVPWWAVAVYGALLASAVLLAVAGVVGQPWAEAGVRAATGPATGLTSEERLTLAPDLASAASSATGAWLSLLGAVLGLAAVGAVVWLAARRRAVSDPDVDRVLRVRTARIAVGVGIGLALGLVDRGNQYVNALHQLGTSVLLDTRGQGVPAEPAMLSIASHVDGWGMLALVVVALGTWLAVVTPPREPLAAVPAA